MQFNMISDTAALCRVCMLAKDGHRTNMYSALESGPVSLHGMLKAVCAAVFDKTEVDDRPGMPTEVCADCRNAIIAAFELHQTCVATDWQLGEMLALRWELQGPEDGENHVDTKDSLLRCAENVKTEVEENEQCSASADPCEKGDDPLSGGDYVAAIKVEALDLMEESYEPAEEINQSSPKDALLCEICNVTYSNASSLRRHQRTFHQGDSSKRVKCKICGTAFDTPSLLRAHKAESCLNLFPCDICKLPFSMASSLKRHNKIFHLEGAKRKATCKMCGEQFASRALMRFHKKESCAKKVPFCNICKTSYSHSSSLRRHQRTFHQEGNSNSHHVTCKICGKEFATRALLKSHWNESCSEKGFSCEMCNISFSMPSSLRRHQRNFHQGRSSGQVTCELCGKDFATRLTMRTHKEMHKGSVVCTCGSEFATNSTLDEHIASGTCSGEQERTCTICEKVFKTAYAIVIHRRTWHSENVTETKPPEQLFHCEQCGKYFEAQRNLNRHQLSHLKNNMYKCKICGETFSSKFIWMKHWRKHYSTYKCRVCGKLLGNQAALTSHMAKHRGHKLYECMTCNQTFETYSALKTHRRNHAGPFKCTICDKLLSTKISLSNHMDRHAGIKKFACDLCPMKFFTTAEINEHMSTHTKPQDWTCEICGTRFSKNQSLKKHIQAIHEGIRSYECAVCSRKFYTVSSLKRHMLTHTKEKPHKCRLCSRAFSQTNDLVKHVAREHGIDKPYPCDRCEESFRFMTELRQHYQVHAQAGDGLGTTTTEEVRFTTIAILQRTFDKDKQKPAVVDEEDGPE